MIRPFEITDLPVMIDLGSVMHRESAYRDLDYSKDKLLALGTEAIENPDTYYAVIAEDGEFIQGMFCGFLMEHFFGRDKLAADLLVYVHPKYRGGTLLVRMLKAFEKWAVENGAKEMRMGITTELHQERTGKLYDKLGFPQIGTLHKKRF